MLSPCSTHAERSRFTADAVPVSAALASALAPNAATTSVPLRKDAITKSFDREEHGTREDVNPFEGNGTPARNSRAEKV